MPGLPRGIQKILQSEGKLTEPLCSESCSRLLSKLEPHVPTTILFYFFSQGAAPEQEPTDHLSLWENKIKTWMERYEEASSNQYSEDVQVLLRVKEQGDGKSLAYNTHPASFKPPVEV